MISTLLFAHLVIGVLIIASGDRLGRWAFAVAALAHAATVAWATTQATAVIDGDPVRQRIDWVPQLGLGFDLRLDGFSMVMVALVSGIGVLVCVYAIGYFSYPKPGTARLAGLMTVFAGAMLGVVVSDSLMALFIFWELTSVTSYLLIGNDDRNPRARAAALQAILITGAGGLVMLVGLIIVGQAAGSYLLSDWMVNPPPATTTVTAALVCILVGAFTKSAQAPFGSWLPGAMIAPTPISAYLHSATMVKAGVYLVAILSPIFAGFDLWRPLILVVGATTMLIGGLRAMRQVDLKLLLAYGTVSQLGFMMLLFGTGAYKIAQAGVVLLLAHGAFKAALFMVVGIVDHQVGTRDVRELHGFGRSWWPTVAVGVLSAASMAGLPPLLGFISKEKAFEGYLDQGTFGGAGVVLAIIVIASVFTFAYSARFVLGLFGVFGDADQPQRSRTAPAPSAVFVAPAVLLTIFTVAAGMIPGSINALVRAATVSLYPGTTPATVKLWAGFNTALALSAAIVAAGVVLVVLRGPVARAQQRFSAVIAPIPSAEQGFLAILKAVTDGSRRLTSVVQHGSLPVYLAVIITVTAAVPLIPAITEFNRLPMWVDAPLQIPLAALVIGAALGAAVVKRRISAALMLGAVGYGMAALFLVQGAPDLALTQFAVETLATVLFVLVLRFLPSLWFDRASAIARSVRLAVSLLAGAAVFVMAIVAAGVRGDVAEPNISDEMIVRSAPDAKGNNVVNVILVDFRGLDTLGEITVVVVAALGAVSLARLGFLARRRASEESGAGSETGSALETGPAT